MPGAGHILTHWKVSHHRPIDAMVHPVQIDQSKSRVERATSAAKRKTWIEQRKNGGHDWD
jgi:hypothetical protein